MRSILPLTAAAVLAASPAVAEDSVGHLSNAGADASGAVANLTVAGIESVGGVVALPLGLAGAGSVAAGAVSNAAGDAFGQTGEAALDGADEMIRRSWGPLAVDAPVIVAHDPAPSREALKPRSAAR